MDEQSYFKDGIKYYQTKRVNETCPLLYRAWMIKELERVRDKKKLHMDYLQIFKFSLSEVDGKVMQKVTHVQEVPEYERTYCFEAEGEGLEDKLYIIDDGAGYATILYADEY